MKWASTQRAALMYKKLGKVIYKNMWIAYHQLGYSSKGSNTKYNVVIAKDAPSKEVRDIVTLHEVGHIIYNHLDVNLKEEFLKIKALCNKHNKSYDLLSLYGGPKSFVNIAMDLEVNGKLLTQGNIKTMAAANFPVCTAEGYDIDFFDNFREYYEPLIERMNSNTPKEENNPLLDVPSFFDKKGENDNGNSSSTLEEEVFGEHFEEPSKVWTIETEEDEDEASPISKLANDEGKSMRIDDDSNLVEVVFSLEKRIADFIKQSVRKPKKNYINDVIRLHNRGTRINKSNILYSSMKRNHVPKPKFCFILDVSDSMDVDPIMKALGTLDFFFKDTSRNSEVLTWNTQLKERFFVSNIPSNVDIGGNTDIAAAIAFAKGEGFTNCVLYSDFDTNLSTLEEASKGINVYSICVDSHGYSGYDPLKVLKESEFYKNHKRMLFI